MMEIYIKSSNAAKDYFYQGEHFLEAAWRCFGQKSDTGFAIVKEDKFQQLSVPCVVNAAFSCEMFFKSLLHQMKIQYGRKNGHNLHSLYKLLPSKVQNIIAKFCGNQKDNAVFENWIENHAEDVYKRQGKTGGEETAVPAVPCGPGGREEGRKTFPVLGRKPPG